MSLNSIELDEIGNRIVQILFIICITYHMFEALVSCYLLMISLREESIIVFFLSFYSSGHIPKFNVFAF